MPFSKANRANTIHGILFVALFSIASIHIASMSWIVNLGISSLVVAILLGIFYGNTLHHRLPLEWKPGVAFSAKRLLRLAIILYGFRVSFQQILSIGIKGLAIDAVIVGSTLLLGYYLGTRVFKLDKHLALLISAGSAICGAAAVLAVEDVIKSEAYKATVAVGTVVLFGTIAMFLYPLLQDMGILGLSTTQFGIFTGASIHEVAQAVVAGTNISAQAGDIAVIVKMTRVLLLVPVLFCITLFVTPGQNVKNEGKKHLTIPWFAIWFVVAIGFNSLHLLPDSLIKFINQTDTFLLTMAMTAIGMETHLGKIRKVGMKPLYLAIILFAWLMLAAYTMVQF